MLVVFLKMIDMVGSVVVVVVMVTMESVRASLAPLQGSHLEQFQLANLILSIELQVPHLQNLPRQILELPLQGESLSVLLYSQSLQVGRLYPGI